ncbi:hypothetical protein [Nocardia aurantia]|uniref:Uncharacterized protein n=1 Tax=Nocardia aurantia TaxID=2585199 RepID=A0A7K0DQG5_9NOCA|nr:hypothetical protein [Nocardia aurantia]MQY27064.1 hypothetical protein [Nocardia aurantia]
MAEYQYRCDLCGQRTGWYSSDDAADAEYIGHMEVHLDPPPDFGPPRKASRRSRTLFGGATDWQPEPHPHIPLAEKCAICGTSWIPGVDRARSADRITCGKPECVTIHRSWSR